MGVGVLILSDEILRARAVTFFSKYFYALGEIFKIKGVHFREIKTVFQDIGVAF